MDTAGGRDWIGPSEGEALTYVCYPVGNRQLREAALYRREPSSGPCDDLDAGMGGSG